MRLCTACLLAHPRLFLSLVMHCRFLVQIQSMNHDRSETISDLWASTDCTSHTHCLRQWMEIYSQQWHVRISIVYGYIHTYKVCVVRSLNLHWPRSPIQLHICSNCDSFRFRSNSIVANSNMWLISFSIIRPKYECKSEIFVSDTQFDFEYVLCQIRRITATNLLEQIE